VTDDQIDEEQSRDFEVRAETVATQPVYASSRDDFAVSRRRPVRPILAAVVALALLASLAWYVVGPATPAYQGAFAAVASPPPPDPAVRVRDAVQRALVLQSVALTGGDVAGFLASVEPSNAALRDELTRRFHSLRGMGVTDWTPTILGSPTRTTGTWRVSVTYRYCVVVPRCRGVVATSDTTWSDSDRIWLIGFTPTSADLNGPRPWEVSALQTAVGPRAIVATSAAYAARLPGLLAEAEKAARFVDRFAKWSDPPSRYVVYVASPTEWQTWHGGSAPWAAGYAAALGNDWREVVLKGQLLNRVDLGALLRHEFAHVVTLSGVTRDRAQTWWLIEGIAEYATVMGGSRALEGIPAIRRYVRSGRWSGSVALEAPPEHASEADVSGQYGVAYLAVRRIVDRFGEARMFDFFEAVVRQARPLTEAAQTTLGASWEDVSADCARYVRSR
jgi:hypothetical protein